MYPCPSPISNKCPEFSIVQQMLKPCQQAGQELQLDKFTSSRIIIYLRVSLHLLQNHPHGRISHDLLYLGVVHCVPSHLMTKFRVSLSFSKQSAILWNKFIKRLRPPPKHNLSPPQDPFHHLHRSASWSRSLGILFTNNALMFSQIIVHWKGSSFQFSSIIQIVIHNRVDWRSYYSKSNEL